MKSVRLLLFCAIAVGAAACEKHPYSELEKLEHQGEFAKKSEVHAAETAPAHTP